MKESAYVKFITNALNSFEFDARQLATPTIKGKYIKKEPVDLFIGRKEGFWRIEVKRSDKDEGKVFYWKSLRNDQKFAILELVKKGINCGVLICWNEKEFTLIRGDEMGKYLGQALRKEDVPVYSIYDLIKVFRT